MLYVKHIWQHEVVFSGSYDVTFTLPESFKKEHVYYTCSGYPTSSATAIKDRLFYAYISSSTDNSITFTIKTNSSVNIKCLLTAYLLTSGIWVEHKNGTFSGSSESVVLRESYDAGKTFIVGQSITDAIDNSLERGLLTFDVSGNTATIISEFSGNYEYSFQVLKSFNWDVERIAGTASDEESFFDISNGNITDENSFVVISMRSGSVILPDEIKIPEVVSVSGDYKLRLWHTKQGSGADVSFVAFVVRNKYGLPYTLASQFIKTEDDFYVLTEDDFKIVLEG